MNNRRKITVAWFFAVICAIPGVSDETGSTLPIPPLLESDSPELVVQEGELQLPFGTSDTLGYNGSYLGPTIRVRNGDRMRIKIVNTLEEATTTHWHGLHVPAEFDGGPHQVVEAGGQWNPVFTMDQPAATLWYHPHLMGRTAEHVYRGMAGLFIIDEEYSDSLGLPSEYGVTDIPLIIQDRRINRDGSFSYSPSMPDVMRGYLGNVVLINGAYRPVLELSGGTYRFRILNGSNSSAMSVYFDDKRNFTVIASDGGFLPESVTTTAMVLSPGERYEILVDFDTEEDLELMTELENGSLFESMHISTGTTAGEHLDHPEGFDYSPVIVPPDPREREFVMEARGMASFTINGSYMDLDTIDFRVKKNSTEIWTIKNVRRGMMSFLHSFHVHDVQFTVLSVNGGPPHPLYAGPKDTVLLFPGDEIKIALRFEDYTGIYMYHCHFLEHEDAGMMGQFIVE